MSFLLAISIGQQVGAAVVFAVVVGAVAFTIFHVQGPEVKVGDEREMAPNRRPALDDEALEGPRLTVALGSALILLVFIAAFVAWQWWLQPGQRSGALSAANSQSVARGAALFAPAEVGGFGCQTCHGPKGTGGTTTYGLPNPTDPNAPPTQVTWQVPPLNVAALLYTDPDGTDPAKVKLRQIIVYGRPNTPMPAWGVDGGGALNDQQIDDLVNYIRSISLTPKQAMAQTVKTGTSGATLFDAYCARCHTRGWSYYDPATMPALLQGGGAFGPDLRGGDTTRQFPNQEDQVQFVKDGTIYQKAYGTRGIGTIESGGMPGFVNRLSDAQIRAIVKYERSLP